MSGEDTIEEDESLLTRQLRLRPLRDEDAPAIAHLASDRHIAEMVSRIPHPYGLEDAHSFLASPAAGYTFAMEHLARRELLGLASLVPRPSTAATFVLGYWLGRPFWGNGYATEAAQALVDHAFRTLAAECVEVRCRVVNNASRRVIQKCGFQYCGTGMDVSLAAGRVASETYRMDRRCWQSLKNWGGA